MRFPVVLVQLALAFLLLQNHVTGCVLMPKPTVLDDYNNSDVVIIARAVSQEKTSKPSGLTNNRVVTTTMEIERVFKGNLRVGDKLTFGQIFRPACGWEFYEDDIGQQYLLYLGSPPKGSKLWYVYGNDRSHRLAYVADDLLYFNNLDAVRGKTRVSGALDQFEGKLDVTGKKIWIMGQGKVYETTTDKNGVYEIYDLPPGRYVLQPQLPAGWKIDREAIGTTTIADRKRQILTRHVVFTLRPRQHAAVDLSFVLDNVVSGILVDASGKPFPDVQLSLEPTEPGNDSSSFGSTDEKGLFAIESIDPGSYVLVVNQDGEKRIEEPFPALYYPGVADRAKARVFRIRAGDSIKGLKMVVPNVEEMVTLQGVVRFADGTPAPKVSARFNPAKAPGVDGGNIGNTDAKGRFSFKVFKGLPGELHADFFAMLDNPAYLFRDSYEDCPQVQVLVKQSGKDRTTIKTPALRINPNADLRHLVLTFPFRACPRNSLRRK